MHRWRRRAIPPSSTPATSGRRRDRGLVGGGRPGSSSRRAPAWSRPSRRERVGADAGRNRRVRGAATPAPTAPRRPSRSASRPTPDAARARAARGHDAARLGEPGQGVPGGAVVDGVDLRQRPLGRVRVVRPGPRRERHEQRPGRLRPRPAQRLDRPHQPARRCRATGRLAGVGAVDLRRRIGRRVHLHPAVRRPDDPRAVPRSRVLLWHRATGVTSVASITADDTLDCNATAPSVSGDGRYVAYVGPSCSGLRPGTRHRPDLRPRHGRAGRRPSRRPSGAAGAGNQGNANSPEPVDLGRRVGRRVRVRCEQPRRRRRPTSDRRVRPDDAGRPDGADQRGSGAAADGRASPRPCPRTGPSSRSSRSPTTSSPGVVAGRPQRVRPRPFRGQRRRSCRRSERRAAARSTAANRRSAPTAESSPSPRSARSRRPRQRDPRRVGDPAQARRGLREGPRQRRDDPDLRGPRRRSGRPRERLADGRRQRPVRRVRLELAEPRPRRRQQVSDIFLRELPPVPTIAPNPRRLRGAGARRGRAADRGDRHERRLGRAARSAPWSGRARPRPTSRSPSTAATSKDLRRGESCPITVTFAPAARRSRRAAPVEHNGLKPPADRGPPRLGVEGQGRDQAAGRAARDRRDRDRRGFPPNTELSRSKWSKGVTPTDAADRHGRAGRFRVQVLVFRNDLIGPRDLVVSPAGEASFPPFGTSFLVASGRASRRGSSRATRSGSGEPKRSCTATGADGSRDGRLPPLRRRERAGDQFCGSCGAFLEWEGARAHAGRDGARRRADAPSATAIGRARGRAPSPPIPAAAPRRRPAPDRPADRCRDTADCAPARLHRLPPLRLGQPARAGRSATSAASSSPAGAGARGRRRRSRRAATEVGVHGVCPGWLLIIIGAGPARRDRRGPR